MGWCTMQNSISSRVSHQGLGTPIAKINLKHACLQCPVHPMAGPCVLSMDRHSDADLRLPFGLQPSPTRPTPLAEGWQPLAHEDNCCGVTAPGFTPEHPKPKLRNRTRKFHSVTTRIQKYTFYRHSGPNVLTLLPERASCRFRLPFCST